MGTPGGNPHPVGNKGTDCRKGIFGESGAVLFRKQSTPTLLSICEYICGKDPTIQDMVLVISALKEITYK